MRKKFSKRILPLFVALTMILAMSTMVYAQEGTEITGFDPIPNIAAGTVSNPTFATSAAAVAVLPTTVTASAISVTDGAVSVPVEVSAWVDTDSYDPTVAADYTFTATLGMLPAGYENTGGFTATVEVVLLPAPIEITGFELMSDFCAGAVSYSYASASEVAAELPDYVIASVSGGAIDLQVANWEDTDEYNPAVAGSYTFTAALEPLPTGYANTGNYAATVEVVILLQPIEITGFDPVPVFGAGTVEAPYYVSASAIINNLPEFVSANGWTVGASVADWVDSDGYNPAVAGNYRFTAVIEDLPYGYANTGNYTAVVDVVLQPQALPEETFVTIGGIIDGTKNPLKFKVGSQGSMAAYAYDPTNEYAGPDSEGYVYQYYGQDNWGSTIYFKDSAEELFFGTPYYSNVM